MAEIVPLIGCAATDEFPITIVVDAAIMFAVVSVPDKAPSFDKAKSFSFIPNESFDNTSVAGDAPVMLKSVTFEDVPVRVVTPDV